MTSIRAQFSVESWDENPFDETVGGAKLTHANVTKLYTGDIDGTSSTQWLMAYAVDKTATFVGLERIMGTIDGRHGSLVLQHLGDFDGTKATGDLIVVSGTNDLNGATGKGSFVADPAGSVTLEIDID